MTIKVTVEIGDGIKKTVSKEISLPLVKITEKTIGLNTLIIDSAKRSAQEAICKVLNFIDKYGVVVEYEGDNGERLVHNVQDLDELPNNFKCLTDIKKGE